MCYFRNDSLRSLSTTARRDRSRGEIVTCFDVEYAYAAFYGKPARTDDLSRNFIYQYDFIACRIYFIQQFQAYPLIAGQHTFQSGDRLFISAFNANDRVGCSERFSDKAERGNDLIGVKFQKLAVQF